MPSAIPLYAHTTVLRCRRSYTRILNINSRIQVLSIQFLYSFLIPFARSMKYPCNTGKQSIIYLYFTLLSAYWIPSGDWAMIKFIFIFLCAFVRNSYYYTINIYIEREIERLCTTRTLYVLLILLCSCPVVILHSRLPSFNFFPPPPRTVALICVVRV